MEDLERPLTLEPENLYAMMPASASTELRGCLFKNVLHMRKRSLIRTESQDSGFSIESYDPVTPSFDAEKFLEGLGFSGAQELLIPDRFIPSLIHRISNMPDESMKQLGTRVWKSIDSFKKKEDVSWFFASASVECDLCINNLQRAHSLPTAFSQESCDSWHPGKSNSSPVFSVQRWLACPPNNCIVWEETSPIGKKANGASIHNQSSTESGIVSIVEEDEVLTASTNLESDGFSDLCGSFDRADDLRLVELEPESSKTSHKATDGRKRLSEKKGSRTTYETRAVCDVQAMKATTLLFSTGNVNGNSKITPSETTSVLPASVCKWSPVSGGERNGCTNHNNSRNLNRFSDGEDKLHERTNSNSAANRDCIEEIYASEDGSATAVANPSEPTDKSEVPEEVSNHLGGYLKRHLLKKMSTDGGLFLRLPGLDNTESNTESESVEKDDGFGTLKDDLGGVTQCDNVSTFPSKKKRHSFDAAYASSSAAEKRNRFRHTRSHNFLFGKREEDSSEANDRVRKMVTDETTACGSRTLNDLQEESQRKLSETIREFLAMEEDNVFHDSGSNGNNSFETFHTASSNNALSDTESSGQYFSCDEFCEENYKTSADQVSFFTNHNRTEQEAVSGNFASLPGDQGLVPAKSTAHTFAKEKCLHQKCYESLYAPNRTFGENVILNKILSHSLKLSLLSPIEKEPKHSSLGNKQCLNESESFSQILNTNDCSSLLESKALKPNVQSLQNVPRFSYDARTTSVKSTGSETSDKTEAEDNRHCVSKPFVHKRSFSYDMSAPKCEVRLINYDGWALFSPTRNPAESNINYNLGIASTRMNSDTVTSKTFTSRILMAANSADKNDSTNNEVFFNEVRLEVNCGEADKGPNNKSLLKNGVDGKFHLGKESRLEVQDEFSTGTKLSRNTENPCARALKDLEDLRIAIQKAKETRMSASRELKLLQELLQGGDNEEDEATLERTTVAEDSTLSSPVLKIVSGNQKDHKTIKALSELQQKSAQDTSQGKEFWEKEIKKAKEEMSQVCHERLSIMEQKLRTTEEDLARALEENGRLKDQLELRSSAALPVCKCNAEANSSDYSHMNGISDEEPKITSVAVKPSIPTKNFWQEWDRLQADLMKAESKADELNILLNQKLIELNKMQLTLSKQTKEMILLEKAYFQLRSHLSRKRLNKSAQSHQSSSSLARASPTTERASEDSSKASDPEIPP